MAEADFRLMTEATGQRIAVALENVSAMVGPPGEVSEAELTAKLADKADVIVDTASGAIASFPDGAAVPAKDITIGIEPVQSGSGDPSPTNVRPISGWTGANVTRCGKNLLEIIASSKTINGITFTVNSDGTVLVNGTATKDAQYQLHNNFTLKAGSYILTGLPSGQNVEYVNLFFNYDNVYKNCGIVFTLDTDIQYCYCNIFIKSGQTVSNLLFKPMIRLASDADPTFAPYTGTTIPISWQSVAGTIYGGTLDVTTGLLTVTMAEVDLGTLNWQYSATDRRFITTNTSVLNTPEYFGLICSRYSTYKSGGWESQPDKSIADAHAVHFTSIVGRLLVHDTAYTDVATFKAAMSGVQLVYELATPQTYQLTPTEVDLLLGDNNVWANTGDSTVTYRADTKLHIQKINAPTDDDMIADAQIASGKYFIIGGNLYRSTTTIPAGDAINPGTNCILTNLADALNALNT